MIHYNYANNTHDNTVLMQNVKCLYFNIIFKTQSQNYA